MKLYAKEPGMKNPADPINREAYKNAEDEEFSPMAPPEAFNPPKREAVSKEKMASFLQRLMCEHEDFLGAISAFEEALSVIQTTGITRAVDAAIREFFRRFDEEFIDHHRREERDLFPRLHERLVESGEHSQGGELHTCIDLMMEEHLKILQLAPVIFTLFGLFSRLPEEASRLIVLDAAVQQSKELVELLRLHIFREDQIVFPLAHKHLKKGELDQMAFSPVAGSMAR
jgi:hemerythrin-like domain-containing protein